MNPIRREVLNGLFVLVISTLLSAAIAAFEIKFNLQLWVLIVIGVAVAVSGYVMFEIALGYMASTEDRELRFMASTEDREKEWLKRVGTPARLELNQAGEAAGLVAAGEAVKAMSPGSDITVIFYIPSDQGGAGMAFLGDPNANAARDKYFNLILERLKLGTTREYKRIICFDQDVLAKDNELKSGVLRVGEGPGTLDRAMGEHCRLMMKTKGCSLYVAPAVLRLIVILYGSDKASISLPSADQDTGGRASGGFIFFCDPPNGEIIEQFRQMERETERRMVAVHKIRFPEDAEPTAERATS